MINIPALSIRQPWTWLIVQGYKPVENRDWKYPPSHRGDFYLHASKGCTKREYEDVVDFVETVDASIIIPPLKELERGGLVGIANMVDCVTESDSPWFFGKYGFVMENVRPIEFIECKGQLGFFDCKCEAQR